MGAAALLSLCVACGGVVSARGVVTLPARVPVRAFPSIWLAGGHLDADEVILERMALHLSSDGKREVRRVDVEQLEPLRLAGRISPATVVVLVEVKLSEQVRQRLQTAPVRVCGVFGCETRYQQVMNTVPELRGEVSLRVYEGPTARVLQRERVHLTQRGQDPDVMRVRLLEALAAKVVALLDVQRRSVDVDLYSVDRPDVERALAQIEEGDWEAGRALLEAEVRRPGFASLPAPDQARVWYDLGVARRFAPGGGGPSNESFDAAARALRRAMELDPQPAFSAALRQLERHRRQHARLAEQQRAARHNFALGRAGAAIPPAPESYQRAGSAAAAPRSPPVPAPPSGPSEELFEPQGG